MGRFNLSQYPKIIAKEIVARSRLFCIEALKLQFSNHREVVFERLLGSPYGSVLVMAIKGNDLILVREYAAGTERYELGFVKGLIDKGETSEQAAIREMKEEIGYGARNLQHLRTFSTNPAYSNFTGQLFIARDLYCEQLIGDEVEPLKQVMWPLDKVDMLFDHHELNDVRCLLGLMMLQNILTKRE